MEDKANTRRKILVDRNFPSSEQISQRQDFERINREYSLAKSGLIKTTFFGAKSFISIVIVLTFRFIYWNNNLPSKTDKPVELEKIKNVEMPIFTALQKYKMLNNNFVEHNKKVKTIRSEKIRLTKTSNRRVTLSQTEKINENNFTANRNYHDVSKTDSVIGNSVDENNENQPADPIEKLTIADKCIENPEQVSQAQALPENKTEPNVSKNIDIVEQQPQFPGGSSALSQFLSDNLHYPEDEKGDFIKGTTYISFIIDKDGTVTNVDVTKEIPGGEKLEKEAIRVVKAMPAWKPGNQNGRPVNVRYTIPIQFNTR